MRYLLDTNVWIDYLTGRFPAVANRIRDTPPDELGLSSVVLAELRYGADKSQRKRHNHGLLDTLAQEVTAVDFDGRAAAAHGEIRVALESRGKPLGAYDTLIAAQALSLGLILVTDNEREFKAVRSLAVENWRR